jgi:hypothetical protein
MDNPMSAKSRKSFFIDQTSVQRYNTVPVAVTPVTAKSRQVRELFGAVGLSTHKMVPAGSLPITSRGG